MSLSRRDFLKLMGIGAVSVAAPKLIFDMGANSRIYAPQVFIPYSLYYLAANGKYSLLDSEAATLGPKKIFLAQSDSILWDGKDLIVPATGFKMPHYVPPMRVNIAA